MPGLKRRPGDLHILSTTMGKYSQAGRQISVSTPLDTDALLLSGFEGQEGISQLYQFQLTMLAELQTKIPFERIVGQKLTVELQLAGQEKRYFNGIVKRLTQGGRDDNFVRFRAEIVPEIWLLTKKVRSRIFQRLTVPEILHHVLAGFDVALRLTATYPARDYCVQYRESDFDFISRLMEDEGIYYYFKHSEGSHQLVLSDMANQHPLVPGHSAIVYEELRGGDRDDMRVSEWEKTQELRAGEFTLWDHSFELPGRHLDASQRSISTVAVGKVAHHLNVGGNDRLEIYDYPGGYAQHFDGVNQNGADQKQNLQQVFHERERIVKIRIEQEEMAALEIRGASDCGNFSAGHKFTLQGHFDADDAYLLARVEHHALLDGDYRSDQGVSFNYSNRFHCLPVGLRFRPQRTTSKPSIAGSQTATVVGPAGEEIFCDKYGRVKVQFHWDREGKKDANSSCWLRVAQLWAGKNWGAFFWPRIGHEVIVVFEEGDPDKPIIVGSVYNDENRPPFLLPHMKDCGGIKSCTVGGAPTEHYSGILFVDRKGQEHLAIHSERHLVMNAEFDRSFTTGRHHGERVPAARTLTVGRLPGTGGGSGGGGPNKATWTPFEPQGLLGLNSTVVYGANVQVAMPLNFQMAVGSNLQVCINPNAWRTLYGNGSQTVPAGINSILGSGLGGNMQLTMGSSANLVMGQIYDINLGPRRITLDVHNKTGIQTCVTTVGTAIGIASGIFLAFYGLDQDDDARSISVMMYELLMQTLMMLAMDMQKIYGQMDDAAKAALEATFVVGENPGSFTSMMEGPETVLQDALAMTGIVTAMVLPLILEVAGEKKLQVETGIEQVKNDQGQVIGTVDN